jgi:integrase
MKRVKGAARVALAKSAVHLFLRASDGMQFKGPELYNAWTGALPPINGWSPHQGRHWWACSVLWRELKKHQHTPHLSNETTAALLENTALSIIRLQVQPQLGHANEATTMVYLRWVMDMLAVPASLEDDYEPSIGTK